MTALLALHLVSCRAPQPAGIAISLNGVAPEVATAVKAAEERANVESSAASWLTLGMVCEANGLSADARRAYERALAHDSRLPRAWYRLAVARGRGGQIDEALAAMDRAIAIDGAYAPAHWRRGLWLLDIGKSAESRQAFEQATRLDAANPGGWIGLARLALHQQQPGASGRDSRAVSVRASRRSICRRAAGNRVSTSRASGRGRICARRRRRGRTELARSVERRTEPVPGRLCPAPQGRDRADPER